MFLAILALVGSTAVVLTSTDLQIAGNYKSSSRAFNVAEAGIEEARQRLSPNSTGQIIDNDSTNPEWTVFIGGTESGSVESLQAELSYTVKIAHLVDAGNVVYWGDIDGDGIREKTNTSNSKTRNIYAITSCGASGGANKTLIAQIAPLSPLNGIAALYVNAPTNILGTSTHVIGLNNDSLCGAGDDVHAIASTLPSGSVNEKGNPEIIGVGPAPDIIYDHPVIDIQAMVDSMKMYADQEYSVISATHTGMHWGTPTPGNTLQDPSSCSEYNVVYYDTGGTDIALTGGCSGCGFLLIDGDLEIHGGFSWYGQVLVTGSVIFTGGGDKNITGALLSGGSTDVDVVGGNANIVWCVKAVNPAAYMPLAVLNWKEEM
jgi:Tfp pilus assembly protein PilX